MGLNMTRTYAEMEVSAAVHEEVKQRLIAAGYNHALHDDGATLDMHGIALTIEPHAELQGGTLEVGHDGRNVIVNHPDLKPDAKGVGHIVFSVDQADDFAALILKNAMELRGAATPDDGIDVLAYAIGNGCERTHHVRNRT